MTLLHHSAVKLGWGLSLLQTGVHDSPMIAVNEIRLVKYLR